MARILYYTLFCFQSLAVLIAFFLSFAPLKKSDTPNFLKNFVWYTTLAVIDSVVFALYFLSYISISSATTFNNITLIFNYSFLGLFIINRLLEKTNIKYKLFSIFWIFFIAMMYFLVKDVSQGGNIAFAFASLGLTFFCIIYYYYLFKNPPLLNITKDPSFWIITGVFFVMSFQTPVSAIGIYIAKKMSYEHYYILGTLTMFTYVIMYLFFSKAFLCIYKKSKV